MVLVQYLLWNKGQWIKFGKPRFEYNEKQASFRLFKLACHYGATKLLDYRVVTQPLQTPEPQASLGC